MKKIKNNKTRRIFLINLILLIALLLSACTPVDMIKAKAYDKMGDIVVGEPVVVEGVSYDKYAYQHLDADTKVVYDQILDTILSHKEKISVSTLDKDVISLAYEAVMADYGCLFWVSGYKFNTYKSGEEIIGLEFEPTYTMTEETRNLYQNQVDEICDEWLAGISMEASDYDKAYYVFTTLINNVDYEIGSENNQNILSVFLNRKTVCQGYADAAWYMLDKLGISSTIVTGHANNETHAWNLVYLEGAYYYMDVTWGNSRFLDLDDSIGKTINYAYLAMTTEELSSTHVIENRFDLPECLSTGCNYYVRNRLYFDSFDIGSIGRTIEAAWDGGQDSCSLKFSAPGIYNQAVDYFIVEQHLRDFCWGIESITYTMNDNVNVLTLMFK